MRAARRRQRQERPQVAEVHEGVGRDDDVEGLTLCSEVFGQLGLHQLGVDLLAPGVVKHPGRQVDADQARRVRPQQWSAQPCTAPGVQHREPAVGRQSGVCDSVLDECRRPVGEALELGLEARRKSVKGVHYKGIRRTRGHVATGARGKHMCCDRVVRLLCQPLLEKFYGLVDLADHAMGKDEQSPRVAVLRPQRERPAEAVRRFLAAAEAIQQDPEVGVGVRVIGR